MSEPVDLATVLPARVWFLSADGGTAWHEGPYTFVFSEGTKAEAFARAMNKADVFAIGIDAAHVATGGMLAAFRRAGVSRLFLDPTVDAATGDVVGQTMRFADADLA